MSNLKIILKEKYVFELDPITPRPFRTGAEPDESQQGTEID
jgi:hypothetical protein